MKIDMRALSAEARRTRRNVLKMGVIFGSAAISGVKSASGSVGPTAIPRCFLRGAKILTIKGEANVEDLVIGDLLPTRFGGVRPIQWIGRYPFKRSNSSKPWPKAARPVQIARSALADNVPHADLYVTQGHGLLIDDVLVPAGCLINGTTITLCEASELDELEFFHVKLAVHDVIYAEGAPVETLLRVDESAVNFAEYFRLREAPASDEVPCAPILSDQRLGSGWKSRYRSAISWMDRRRQIAAIRDRLQKRGSALVQEVETSL